MDYISNDDHDLFFGDTEYPNDTFNIDRHSKDINVYKRFGFSLNNICCDNDIHNGRLYDDVDGNTTFKSNEGKSLVDFIVASTSLFDKFTYFCIGTQYFSEHFSVTCTLKLHALNMDIPNSHYNDNFTSSWYKYNLKDTLKWIFSISLGIYIQTSRTIYNITKLV